MACEIIHSHIQNVFFSRECFKETEFLFHFNQMYKDIFWDVFMYGMYTEVWKCMVCMKSFFIWGFSKMS